MIGEIVENRVIGKVFAGHALAIEEDILRFEIPAQVALGHNARRHVPINRSGAAVRFLDTIAIGIVGVGVTCGASDAVFDVVSDDS